MRKPFIAGNWKMNKTSAETKEILAELKPLVAEATCDMAICVPFTDLSAARKELRGSNIKLGAQNVHWAESGAFTGEISAAMLKEQRVDYVILGHSERRQYFGETSETVNKRAVAALGSRIRPIVCVGETLIERETGHTEEVLYAQVTESLKGFKTRDFEKIIIAYEPVWAIGTGKTATPEEANENTRILYGGSMNAGNVKQLMAMPEIDGGLIGGASLKPEEFARICNYNL